MRRRTKQHVLWASSSSLGFAGSEVEAEEGAGGEEEAEEGGTGREGDVVLDQGWSAVDSELRPYWSCRWNLRDEGMA